MPPILLVGEDEKLLQLVTQELTSAGFAVACAISGDGSDQINTAGRIADAIILDLERVNQEALYFIRDLRGRDFKLPILALLARDAVQVRVEVLDAGADCCLTKPVDAKELLARLRALLRRNIPGRPPIVRAGALELDLLQRTVLQAGKPVVLQRREFDLLVFLIRKKNTTVTRQMIARELWRQEAAQTNVIEVHIAQLRKKLDSPGKPPMIETVRGEGYVFRET